MSGALDGIRVLDLSRALAGPYCSQLLGDMGARVVKVEPPAGGDESRRWGPFWNDQSCYFLSTNRNKESIVIDLKHPAGLEVALALARGSDVLVENFRPGVADRLGFEYEELAKVNPRLVYCSISGFGQGGPRAEEPAYDLAMQGFGGLMSITGYPGGPPVRVGLPVTDFGAGLLAAYGIVTALYRREALGRGQKVETSLLAGQLSWIAIYILGYLADGTVPAGMGSSHHFITPYSAFKAEDGHFILAVGNDGQWQRLCQAVDAPDLAQDSRFRTNADRLAHRNELFPLLEAIFADYTTAELIALLSAAGVPCGPVNTIDRLLADSQVESQNLLQQVPHPDIPGLQLPAIPLTLSDDGTAGQHAPPLLGQHTDAILRDLGYGEDRIAALRRDGAVA